MNVLAFLYELHVELWCATFPGLSMWTSVASRIILPRVGNYNTKLNLCFVFVIRRIPCWGILLLETLWHIGIHYLSVNKEVKFLKLVIQEMQPDIKYLCCSVGTNIKQVSKIFIFSVQPYLYHEHKKFILNGQFSALVLKMICWNTTTPRNFILWTWGFKLYELWENIRTLADETLQNLRPMCWGTRNHLSPRMLSPSTSG